ncbi:hypothetical protein HaLaN_09021, partial [Haematococcus lacustris]
MTQSGPVVLSAWHRVCKVVTGSARPGLQEGNPDDPEARGGTRGHVTQGLCGDASKVINKGAIRGAGRPCTFTGLESRPIGG